ncbi:MAG: helix-turn-helix transcriptional regulator [Propionibacteriaceae bacterium]|jgi:transcriptional regulator with XRE-family HTH domain|nr:helix-turn-helix transcriptional regulator [Propionibacteriaceae bacterium]
MAPFPQRIVFGARVRALRTDRGWSQEEFAHRANLDRTYVSGVERGVRNPTLDVITRFAATLEVEVADLFPRSAAHSDKQSH